MKNLLVPVEFDEKTTLILNKAIELAEKFGSKVWIVHIASPDPDFVGYDVGPQYIRDNRAEDLRKEHTLIQKYTDEVKQKGIDTEGLLIQGATAEMILKECVTLHIDLIIMGHRKHGFFHKAFGDSTVSSIIDKSQVPVLLIPLN